MRNKNIFVFCLAVIGFNCYADYGLICAGKKMTASDAAVIAKENDSFPLKDCQNELHSFDENSPKWLYKKQTSPWVDESDFEKRDAPLAKAMDGKVMYRGSDVIFSASQQFEKNKTSMRVASPSMVDLVKRLSDYPDARVVINGDPGSNANKADITRSRKRSDSISKYLQSKGVDKSKISITTMATEGGLDASSPSWAWKTENLPSQQIDLLGKEKNYATSNP